MKKYLGCSANYKELKYKKKQKNKKEKKLECCTYN